jgi:iron complex outermembrane receptor protein
LVEETPLGQPSLTSGKQVDGKSRSGRGARFAVGLRVVGWQLERALGRSLSQRLSWGSKVKANSFYNRHLLGTSALAAVLMSSAAFAQDNSQTMETVTVTGIRASLENATVIKRNADTFVDSITASDVSALPDTSVAEALGRIPGVTVTRYQYGGASPDFPSAEGSGNLVRGLSFVRSEFNGRDEFTANGGRALDWSSVPPELVSGVDVYKESSAELIEGGIGGTINLRTLEPFDRSGFFAAVTGDATFADLRHAWSPSYSGIISDRWQTGIGEFGLMGSYSFSNLKSDINDWQQGAPIPRLTPGTDETSPQGSAKFYANGTNNPQTADPSTIVGTIPVFQLRHPVMDRDRSSYYIAAQWQNENTVATFKFVSVHNRTNTVEHTIEHLPGYGDPSNTTITNMTTRPFDANVALCNTGEPTTAPQYDCNTMVHVGGGLMQSGLITSDADSWTGMYGYQVNTLSRGVVDLSTTTDYSFNVKSQLSDHWHLNVDAQYTNATASHVELWGGGQTHMMVYEKTGLNDPVVSFTMDPRGNKLTCCLQPGQVSNNNTDTGNPNAYFWLYSADQEQFGSGELWATRADVVYDLDTDWFKDVKFGARYAVRSQVNDQNGQNWAGVAPPWNGAGAVLFSSLTEPGLVQTDDYRNFFGGNVVQGANTKFEYIGSSYLLNYNKFAGLFQGPNADPILHQSLWQPRNPMFANTDISNITERTMDFYGQVDFKHEFANGMSWDGNIGLRYARTNMTSAGGIGYTPFGADPACTPGSVTSGSPPVTTVYTVYGCSHNSARDFFPQTAAYLDQAGHNTAFKLTDDHYLPSFNLKWNLNDEMLLRFGASDNLTRPNVQDMRAGQNYGASVTLDQWPANHCVSLGYIPPVQCQDGNPTAGLKQINVSGGNPLLKPTTARSFDVSYEWYFDGGSFTAAGFYKRLHNIIAGGTLPLGSITLDGQTVPIVYNGQVNEQAATVKGTEIEYQQFYDFLPGLLSHLGSQINFTYIDAGLDTAPPNCFAGGGDPCRFNVRYLYGQSKYIMNLIAIYQDDHIEARLAYDWRSKYLVSLGDYMTGNPIFNSPSGNLDGSFKYNFDEHLQLRASFENILDTKNKARMLINSNNQWLDRYSVLNDRRFIFGARYQF